MSVYVLAIITASILAGAGLGLLLGWLQHGR
jgi:hypothetical protein